MQVPSAIPIKKAPTKPGTKTPVQTNPSVKRIVTSGGRTITIPPRRPSVNPSTKEMISPNSPDENEEEVKSSSGPDDLSISQENMDWWSDISDLERLNVLNSPLEDRARILASKTSTPIEQTMLEIGRKTNLTFLNRFELSENPTKLIPLRLIHSFNCLPIEANKDAGQVTKDFVCG